MAVVKIKNVTYEYPLTEEPALKNINLELEEGKFYGLVGENGSGKTTLCNLIRGFVPYFFQGELTGEIELFGRNIDDYTMGELALKVGYIFQNPFNQISGVKDTVYEEVAYGLENFGVPKEEIVERVDRVIKLTKIEELKDKNPFELSGGQQQRVALASVIVLEPDLLVIDEPTSQLDPISTEQVFEIINMMKEKGKTIILVEHKMDLIAQYADEIIALEDKTILKQGSKHEVFGDLSLEDHGIMIPEIAKIGNWLSEQGFKMDHIPVTEEEAVKELKAVLERRQDGVH